jgi:hypothetical protein
LGEKIPVVFINKVLEDESFKDLILMKMVSNILVDIVRMPIYFKERHTDEDGNVGYHTNDIEYDQEMIKFVQRVFEDEVFTEVMEEKIKESLPLKTFTSYANVTINYTMEVQARTYEEAEQMFENASQADYTKEEESSHSFREVEMGEGRA